MFTMLFLGENVNKYFYIGFVLSLVVTMVFIGINYSKVMDYEKALKIEKIDNNIFLYNSGKEFYIDTFINKLKHKAECQNEVYIFKKRKNIVIVSDVVYFDEHKRIADDYYDIYLRTSKNGVCLYSVLIGDESSLAIIKEQTIEYAKKSITTQIKEFVLDENYTVPKSPTYAIFLYDVSDSMLKGFYIKKVLRKHMNYLIKLAEKV